jgi:hypothetical protein
VQLRLRPGNSLAQPSCLDRIDSKNLQALAALNAPLANRERRENWWNAFRIYFNDPNIRRIDPIFRKSIPALVRRRPAPMN